MAQTQAQWYSKLKTWVPEWFFEKEIYSKALFSGMAKVLSMVQEDVDFSFNQTFIDRAIGNYLDLLGAERGVTRIDGEFDAQYAVRIKSKGLVSQANRPAILAIVNALLIQGVASMKEDWEGGVFFNRGAHFNRSEILISPIENTFTLVVDKQIPDPNSFFDREYFADREDFFGKSESSDYVFQLILNAVNDNKALGVFYRIFERLN